MSSTDLNNLLRLLEIAHWFVFYLMLFAVIGLSGDVTKLNKKIKELENKENE